MDLEKIVNEKFYNNKRLNHIYGVANTAKLMAKIHDVDAEKAYIAGLLHDFCKYDSYEFMESLMDKSDIEKLQDAKEVYHAYASSEYARRFLDIKDEDILNAIKYHVYGRINMTDLEKIIVISDFCEPNRDFIEAKMVYEKIDDLDVALIDVLEYSIKFLYEKNKKPLDEQLEVLKYYKEKYNGIN